MNEKSVVYFIFTDTLKYTHRNHHKAYPINCQDMFGVYYWLNIVEM